MGGYVEQVVVLTAELLERLLGAFLIGEHQTIDVMTAQGFADGIDL